MLKPFSKSIASAFRLGLPCALAAVCFALPLGTFDQDTTVSPKTFAGHSEFNASTGEYTIAGASGEIGGKADSFHFVWKRVSGDVTLNDDARFSGTNTDKSQAALTIRQSLDPDAAYVAAVVYGGGQDLFQLSNFAEEPRRQAGEDSVEWTPELVRWRFFSPNGPRHVFVQFSDPGEFAVLSLGPRQGIVPGRLIALPDAAIARGPVRVQEIRNVLRMPGAHAAAVMTGRDERFARSLPVRLQPLPRHHRDLSVP
jgi:hypothetical protein